jgi:hypothetical protein
MLNRESRHPRSLLADDSEESDAPYGYLQSE